MIFLAICRNIRTWTIEWKLEPEVWQTGISGVEPTVAEIVVCDLRHMSRVFLFPVYRTKRFKYGNFAQIFSRNISYNNNVKGFIL